MWFVVGRFFSPYGYPVILKHLFKKTFISPIVFFCHLCWKKKKSMDYISTSLLLNFLLDSIDLFVYLKYNILYLDYCSFTVNPQIGQPKSWLYSFFFPKIVGSFACSYTFYKQLLRSIKKKKRFAGIVMGTDYQFGKIWHLKDIKASNQWTWIRIFT